MIKMKYGNVKCHIASYSLSFGVDVNDEGTSLNIFFDGCDLEPKCRDCQNPDLWVQKEETETNVAEACKQIGLHSDVITHVVFTGGEPLMQPKATYHINKYAQELGLQTWLYTGHEYSHVPSNLKKSFNCICSGRYDRYKLNPPGTFPASYNQIITRNDRIEFV
jgi:organic radical activating enzyme